MLVLVNEFLCFFANDSNVIDALQWLNSLIYIYIRICFKQRWVRCFQSEFIHIVVSTTNGIERLHEQLKYSFLSDRSTGSMTDIVTVITQDFIPLLEQR